MSYDYDHLFAVWAKWRDIPCWLRYLHMLDYQQKELDELEYIDDRFYLFADAEERAWREKQRENLPRMEREWLIIFPEAKRIIPAKISEWKAQERKLLAALRYKVEKLKTLSGLDAIIYREWLKIADASDIADVRRHIRRLRFALAPPKANSKRITQVDIEMAKSVPLQSLLHNSYFVRSGSQLKTLCPLHQEKTPSFYIRPERNTFHCFGCNKSGSAIDLVMLLYECGFVNAVKRIVLREQHQPPVLNQ